MEYLTINETAELLRVTRQTIINYIKANKLKAFKTGKQYIISREEINRFLEEECSNK